MSDGDKINNDQKKLRQAEEGRKAMQDYEAQAEAMRAKTEKLRALRLARDAESPPPIARAPARKAGKSAKAGKAKPKPLSEWLDDQAKDGR